MNKKEIPVGGKKLMPKYPPLKKAKIAWKLIILPPKAVIFFAKRFRFLVTFGVGVYTGVYMAQNYDIPKVVDPQQLWKNIQDYLETHKKQ